MDAAFNGFISEDATPEIHLWNEGSMAASSIAQSMKPHTYRLMAKLGNRSFPKTLNGF